MRDALNIVEVASLQPDYMGFIFYAGSRRTVPDNFQIPEITHGIKRVGVFVNESTPSMLNKSIHHSLDFLQLHGNESPDQCRELRDQGVQLIKVFSVDDGFDFASTAAYKGTVDFFMFDTKGPGYGGTGMTFDWTRLEKYDQEVPFFLSGGISPDNIEGLNRVRRMNIHAIDVNSGVESEPGRKSVEKISRIQKRLLNRHWLEY